MNQSTPESLLFGVVAVELGLIDARTLVEAYSSWEGRRAPEFSDLLERRGDLTAEGRRLVERHLRRISTPGEDGPPLVTVGSPQLISVLAGSGSVETQADLSLATVAPPTADRRPGMDEGPAPAWPRYSMIRVHAKGGLGTVWLARDTQLNREVALKEINHAVADEPEMRDRFLHEAQITGQLEHPNIVPVYELARRPTDGQPFYTMRFVRGRTFREAIAEHHARRKEGSADTVNQVCLLHTFVSVCQAVGYAHSRGVIHRDLKPENVVVGDFGEVILLDWGLAKIVGRAEEAASAWPVVSINHQDSAHTVGHIGTPAYMAPEQAEARHDRVDARTDVYGLGAMLFEILTGAPPHRGRNTAELLNAIVVGESPRARERNPETPRCLDSVCAKAMSKRPEDRYARASDLAKDVQRWLADEPVSAGREPFPDRARRWLRRHRTTLAVVSALALTAVSASIAALGLVAYRQTRLALRQTERLLTSEKLISDQREYFSLYEQARSLRADRAPGWSRIADSNLTQAARHLAGLRDVNPLGWDSVDHARRSLRNEVVAGLLTVDVDPELELPLEMGRYGSSYEFAVSPDGRELAVFDRFPLSANQFGGAGFRFDERRPTRTFAFPPRKTETPTRGPAKPEQVRDVTYSPDGRWLAVGTSAGQVRIWDLSKPNEPPAGWVAHEESVKGLAFARDSRALYSTGGGEEWSLRRWRLPIEADPRPEPERKFAAVKHLSAPAVSADGTIVMVTTEKGLHRLDPETMEGPVLPGLGPDDFAVSPDGMLLAAHDSRVLLQPLRGGQVRAMVEPSGSAHSTEFRVRFSPKGALLATACPGEASTAAGRNIKVWEMASRRPLLTIPVAGQGPLDAHFTPDARHLIYIANGRAFVRRMTGYEVMTTAAHTTSPLSATAWSPDGAAVVGVAGEAADVFRLEVTRWDLQSPSRTETRVLELPGIPPDALERCGLACRPDGRAIALTTPGKLHFWQGAGTANSRLTTVDLPDGRAQIAYSPDSQRLWGVLACSATADRLFVADGDGGRIEFVQGEDETGGLLRSGRVRLNGLAARGGGVLVGGMNHYFLFDDASASRPARAWSAGLARVRGVGLSGNGRWLALGFGDGGVALRRPSDDRLIQVPGLYQGRVAAVALSHDGSLFASGSDDATVRIHRNDGESIHEVFSLPPRSGAIVSLEFSPDDSNLLILVENEYAARVLHLGRLRERLSAMRLGW